MHLVPAPAVRLMKRRVQSRPGLRQENRFLFLVWMLHVFDDFFLWILSPGAYVGENPKGKKEIWESREMS